MKNYSSNPYEQELIDIVSPSGDGISSARWMPSVGEETLALLEHLNLYREDEEKLKNEALDVLSRCLPPTSSDGSETGLVIGYVQSGKTMSFTTVATLARDNGYRLIIIVTGLTVNLFAQSRERLAKDLRLNERNDRKWQFLPNPKSRPEIQQRIAAAIDWDDVTPGLSKQTVLIVVMKNGSHLDHLLKLLSRLSLKGVPALIIDDEADQASLNNKVKQRSESATYRRITSIRRLIPHHTFLQYTATPQAPLLINLIDVLSPKFAEVLSPGMAYTGGRTFFTSGDFVLVEAIPSSEMPASAYPLSEPPESLLKAMRIFFLGVAAGMMQGSRGNRSMMVHPSKRITPHENYVQWVRQIKQHWERTLGASANEPDRRELLDDFRRAYDDLCRTVLNIAGFEELQPYLRGAIKSTVVTEVNASRGKTPELDWRQDYSHILVGGEVLNRGYTVQGLTVSYMPRGKGVGNADTVQQRARWFGYKADYLGYCRIYLDQETLEIYRSYVDHEERIRSELTKYRETGKSLREWRRAFFLSPKLRPTRHNVLDLEYMRGNFSDSWFRQSSPHNSDVAIRANRELVNTFCSQVPFVVDTGHPKRTEAQKHYVASGINLNWLYQELLTQYQVTHPNDSRAFTGALLQIARYLEFYSNAVCTIYLMSMGKPRDRSVDSNNEIPTLFQGPNPDRSGEYYPGDRHIRAERGLTLQIHILNILDGGQTIAQIVPTMALWIPEEMSANWISQHQEIDE